MRIHRVSDQRLGAEGSGDKNRNQGKRTIWRDFFLRRAVLCVPNIRRANQQPMSARMGHQNVFKNGTRNTTPASSICDARSGLAETGIRHLRAGHPTPDLIASVDCPRAGQNCRDDFVTRPGLRRAPDLIRQPVNLHKRFQRVDQAGARVA